MSWLIKALSTSVGRKFVMAITGLLLCGFLVAHLAGNLLLYVGAQEYNDYAHALHKQAGLLVVAEIGLFSLFIAHIVIALQVSAENRLARKVGYAMKQSKQVGRNSEEMWRPDSWMLFTGIGVLGFLVLHMIDFKFGTELQIRDQALYFNGTVEKTPYDKAAALLSTPLTMIAKRQSINPRSELFLSFSRDNFIPFHFHALLERRHPCFRLITIFLAHFIEYRHGFCPRREHIDYLVHARQIDTRYHHIFTLFHQEEAAARIGRF